MNEETDKRRDRGPVQRREARVGMGRCGGRRVLHGCAPRAALPLLSWLPDAPPPCAPPGRRGSRQEGGLTGAAAVERLPPECLLRWPARRCERRRSVWQLQVLEDGADGRCMRQVRQHPPPAPASGAGEDIHLENAAQQSRPVEPRCALTPPARAHPCCRCHRCLLLARPRRCREQKWPEFRARCEDAMEARQVHPDSWINSPPWTTAAAGVFRPAWSC